MILLFFMDLLKIPKLNPQISDMTSPDDALSCTIDHLLPPKSIGKSSWAPVLVALQLLVRHALASRQTLPQSQTQ